MRRGRLQRPGDGEHLADVLARGRDDRDDRHLAGRHRSGLVENHRVDVAGRLQHLRALDQDSQLGAAAGADEQRRGRREPERAGAGDHQHRGRGEERGADFCADAQPEPERRGGQQQHGRDEHRRHAVGQALHGGLAALRLLDERGDLGQAGLGADAGGAHDEPAAHVHAPADHGVALGDLDGHRLAGEHARVDGRGTLDDDTVGRDLLAGPDDEAVADHDLLDRHAHLAAAAHDRRLRRGQPHQRVQRGPGAPAGACLRVAAGEHERGDPGGDLEVQVRLATRGGQGDAGRVSVSGCTCAAEQEGVERPAVRGQRPHRDEGVHRGGRVPQVRQRGAVERQRAPPDDDRRQRERHPLPVVELQRRHHGGGDDRQRQQTADQHPDAEPADRIHCLDRSLRGRQRRGVARTFDGGQDLLDGDGAGVGDGRLLRRVVHGGRHAVELVERPLDPPGARAARHAADEHVDVRGRLAGGRRGGVERRGHRASAALPGASRTATS